MVPQSYFWIFVLCCHFTYTTYVNSFIVSTSVSYDVGVHEVPRVNARIFTKKTTEDEQLDQSIAAKLDSFNWRTLGADRVSSNNRERVRESIGKVPLFSTKKYHWYCVERNIRQSGDNVQHINLLWSVNGINITDNYFPEANRVINVTEFETNGKKIFDTSNKDCLIYLNLDCDIVETENSKHDFQIRSCFSGDNKNKNDNNRSGISSGTNSEILIDLVEEHNMSGYTETKFLTDGFMNRIDIDISGNLSRVLLQIPLSTTMRQTGMKISLARKNVPKGMRIDTRNTPSGEWWLKLTGVENSNYHLTVKAFVEREETAVMEDNLFVPDSTTNAETPPKGFNDRLLSKYYARGEMHGETIFKDTKTPYDFSRIIPMINEEKDWTTILSSKLPENPKVIFERSLIQDTNDETLENKSSDVTAVEESPTVNDKSISDIEPDELQSDDSNAKMLNNVSNHEENHISTSLIEEQPKLRAKSSIALTEDFDLASIKNTATVNANMSMRMIEILDDQESSEGLVKYANEGTVGRTKMLIDVNQNTDLLVKPGRRHTVVFDVINNCALPVRYVFTTKSSHFAVYNIQPNYAWIYPGQMTNVYVDLLIPTNIAPDTINTLTLSILGTEIKEKSVYLYAQSSLSKFPDDVKPTIEYYFNNNCAEKMDKDRCAKSRWSVDITVQDPDSGLKRVISSPNEIYPRTDFVSGTRNSVTFYYSATCCDATAKITAVDLLNNRNSITIDVTAWDNLSGAQIATITLAALIILLLIILIILIILYCVRRKKSHDLPYTQRYGSRSPPRAERTSF